ncbi:phosphotransferase family protein [Streptomyces sp. SID12501]|uniref:Phosphotransferase n=1 Tax=Streptomyces sp. SID12501 TaxID=2706042 RepID=A0A6B3C1R7_9ACTN|nr:phosphotransferase [Streptomyces sp. SID12501]NEC90392.1 phosphotransferase [Streptomyces sp. SID12501]
MDRIDWHDLPAATRAAVERHTGPVEAAETAPHGVMSRLACTIRTRFGRVFVKGTRHDDPQAWVYRHEAQVTGNAPLAPHVLWEVDAGEWQLYGYEYVDGRHPDLTPGSDDLGPLMRTLTVLSEVAWPEDLRKKPLYSRWAEFLPEDVPPGLQGRALAHTDMSPHNMLVTPAGELLLLDWALSCPAPAWADTALTIPRLISAGHTPEQAEAIAQQVPAYSTAGQTAVTTFARTLYAAWEDWERTRPLPHRAALTAAARTWAAHRDTGRQAGARELSP